MNTNPRISQAVLYLSQQPSLSNPIESYPSLLTSSREDRTHPTLISHLYGVPVALAHRLNMPLPPQLSFALPAQVMVQAFAPLVCVAAAGLVVAAQHSLPYSNAAYGYGGLAALATSMQVSIVMVSLARILVTEWGEESKKQPM